MVTASAQRDFNFGCQEIQDKILDRMSAHEQILRSGAAFYGNAKGVTRRDWRRFAIRQNFEQQLPGIQGLGFALLIPREQLEHHLQEIRAEGFPDYQVHPEGDREVYSATIYLEPLIKRNLRTFGYDMLTEPVRRVALERARDHDAAALSGKVTLMQETDKDVQAGTLMYVPVYQPGQPIETVDQRRDAILGWVYSPYRMNDLMNGILGGWGLTSDRRIRLEIFDGDTATPAALLYDSQATERQLSANVVRVTRQSRVVSAGRPWILQFTRPIAPISTADFINVWLGFFGGTGASLLLGWWVVDLIKTRLKARQLASRLNTELRESETRLTAVLKATASGVLLVDAQGRILLTNPQFAELWRVPDELIRAGHDEAVLQHVVDQLARPEEFLQAVRRLYASEDERFDTLEFKDGRVFERYTNIVKSAGRQLGRLWSFRDITAHRQAETELRMQGSALRAAANTILITDPTGKIMWTNPAFTKLTGYEISEVLGKNMRLLKSGRHSVAFYRQLWATIAAGQIWSGELVNKRKDGSLYTEDMTITPIRSERGAIINFIAIKQDITARKLAAEKIATSLHEKEALLKEVHHRVKNNLQIITSLLNLQARQSVNPTVAAALNDTKERIRSMALLHERLYQGGNLAEVDFAVYVQNLCAHLASSYRATDGNVELVVQVEAVALDLESAIPCGLLITELVTNALKHAFPAGRAGKIVVALQYVAGGRLMLRVADNGIGLPTEAVPAQPSSLGMQLVHTLAGQLGGVVERESGPGTILRVVFGKGLGRSTEDV